MKLKSLVAIYSFLIYLLVGFNPQAIKAQDDDGFIDIRFDLRANAEKASVEGTDITIFADDKEFQKIKADKRGGAKAELKYGPKYRVVFSKAGFVSCYFLLNSAIAQKKKVTISSFAQTVFLIGKTDANVDTARYKHPFTKWYYDRAENRFKEDDDYLKEFASGIFKEDEIAKEQAAKEAAEKQAQEKVAREKKEAIKQKHAALKEEYKSRAKIAGKIVVISKTETQKPVVGAKVSLYNSKKEQIGITTTNALGGFVFSYLNSDANGMFDIVVEDVNARYLNESTVIAITNNEGKEVKRALVDSKGKFVYRFLSADKKPLEDMVVGDAELKMDIDGQVMKSLGDKLQPLANITLNYVDELGNVIVSVTTDANGKFHFKSLANDAYYLFSIDEKDVQLKPGEKVVLTNSKGKIVREIMREGMGHFNFEIISSDQNELTTLYYDDPWLKVIDPSRGGKAEKGDLVIKEKVYFKSNDATLLPEAKRVMDEVVNVMENVQYINIELSSHSDSKGSDEYNLALSKKRAKASVDYIISQGISAGRIAGIGYGETKLINKCANGVECTEEEHAENRRLEFKVLHK